MNKVSGRNYSPVGQIKSNNMKQYMYKTRQRTLRMEIGQRKEGILEKGRRIFKSFLLLMTIENKSEELGICKAGSMGNKEISQAGTNLKELQNARQECLFTTEVIFKY